jgi:hypothetical protein
MVLIASVAVSPTPRTIGWSLKLSMSSKVSSPAGMSARIFSIKATHRDRLSTSIFGSSKLQVALHENTLILHEFSGKSRFCT